MGNEQFGGILQSLRQRNSETQPMLAKVLGVSRSAISMYESGAREPDFKTLEAIADHYHVPMDYLLGRIEAEKAPTDTSERQINDEDIKFALFGGSGEITDAMFEEVRNFAAYVKQREEQKKKE